MAKRKTEILALFRESFEVTRELSDELFGKLMRAVCAYRFTGELVQIEEPEVRMALRFVISQVDRYGNYCQQKREAAKERYNRQKEEALQEEAHRAPKECKTPETREETQHKDTVQEEETLQGDAESCTEATETEEKTQQQPQKAEEGLQKDAKDPSISMSTSTSTSMSDDKACTKNISDRKKEEREAAAAAPPHTFLCSNSNKLEGETGQIRRIPASAPHFNSIPNNALPRGKPFSLPRDRD